MAESITRENLHVRQIHMSGWRRSDGLFEIEGHVTDRKPFDFHPVSGDHVVKAEDLIHNLGLRLVFDADRVIREVHTFSEAYPYEECSGGGASLQALVGLRIGEGWSSEVRKRLKPSETCAHLRELLTPLATAVVQTMSPFSAPKEAAAQGKSPLIDSCYAYDTSRKIVFQRWPKFHRPKEDSSLSKLDPEGP